MKQFRGLLCFTLALGCVFGISGYASYGPPEASIAGHISFDAEVLATHGEMELTLSAVKKADGRIKGHLEFSSDNWGLEVTGKILALDVTPDGTWAVFFEVTESNVPSLVGVMDIIGGSPTVSGSSEYFMFGLVNAVSFSPDELLDGPFAYWLYHYGNLADPLLAIVITGNIVAKLHPNN